jgi:type II secretory pathway component GspD/PulD (secretin)
LTFNFDALEMRNTHKACFFVPGLFLLLFCMVSASFAEMVVIPMQYRSAVEALPMVKEFLSSGGRAVADPRTNALLLDDDEASIQKIREFLAGFDRLGKQATVRVRFEERSAEEDRSAAASASASGREWRARAGRPRDTDGVDVRLEDRSAGRRGTSEYSVTVVAGSPAYIMVGEEILFTEKWLDLTRRYARVVERISIQKVETGMEVRPTLLQDHADMEIIPRLSERGPGKGVIRFTEAATRVLAPYGRWVTIGGARRQENEVIREIFSRGRGEKNVITSISLMVEPGNPP